MANRAPLETRNRGERVGSCRNVSLLCPAPLTLLFGNLEDGAAAVRAAPVRRAVEIARFVLDQASVRLEAIGASGGAYRRNRAPFQCRREQPLNTDSKAIRTAEQRRCRRDWPFLRIRPAWGSEPSAPPVKLQSVVSVPSGASSKTVPPPPPSGRRRAEEIARAVRNQAANGKDAVAASGIVGTEGIEYRFGAVR